MGDPTKLAQHRTSPTHTKMKFLKNGRVAIITRGRQAGKKVVIIQPQDSGSKAYPFPHALVAGIERYPLKVTKRMGKNVKKALEERYTSGKNRWFFTPLR